MIYPVPRDSAVQSQANDVPPSRMRLSQIPNAERRHHLNFRCLMMQAKKNKKERRRRPIQGTKKRPVMMQKLLHLHRGRFHQHHPRHRWMKEDADRELLCLTSSTDAPTAARERAATTEGGVKTRGWKTCQRERGQEKERQ